MKLSQWFKREEFSCKCNCNFSTVDAELLLVLDELREHFGKPVKITSAARCVSHNHAVGGSAKSKHLQGLACDVQVEGIKPAKVYRYLTTEYPHKYGFGLYVDFVHCDVRSDGPARWNQTT